MSRESLWQVHLQPFAKDIHLPLALVKCEAICHTVVIGPEVEAYAATERHRQLVGAVRHFGLLQRHDGMNHLIYLCACCPFQFRVLSKLLLSDAQTNWRGRQDLFLTVAYAQGELLAYSDYYLDFPIGREQCLAFLCHQSRCGKHGDDTGHDDSLHFCHGV